MDPQACFNELCELAATHGESFRGDPELLRTWAETTGHLLFWLLAGGTLPSCSAYWVNQIESAYARYVDSLEATDPE